MPNVFFTADLHLNHQNLTTISRWDSQNNIRDFPNEYEMNWKIIRRWNSRVAREDTVYHLGDFVIGESPYQFRREAPYWERQLNGKIVHLLGNHDNRGFKKVVGLESAVFNLRNPAQPNRRKIRTLLTHYPIRNFNDVPSGIDLVLSGHIHGMWTCKPIEEFINAHPGRRIPNINVGIDVWDLAPVSEQEIYELYSELTGKK